MNGQITKEGKYLRINKNTFYDGIDGARYIPRSNFYAKGDNSKIAIIEKQEEKNGRYTIETLVLTPAELKDILGITKRGVLTID